MKQILLLLLFVVTTFSAYCQTPLIEGDHCFEKGDYICAEAKYNEAFNSGSEKEKESADMNLIRVRTCIESLKEADQAFAKKDYKTAKENYQKVLDTNLKDSYAKAQIKKCDDKLRALAITLSVSQKNLSFPSSGGSEKITVTTTAPSFSVENLPAWCTVQTFSGHFVLTCSTNTGNTPRTHTVIVTAGEKIIRIPLTQAGVEKQPETTLKVTAESFSFPSAGGQSTRITVYTNANSYSVSAIPSWCSVQTFPGYFVITCHENLKTTPRSHTILVMAGEKTIRIPLYQSGAAKQPETPVRVTVNSPTSQPERSPQSTYSPSKRQNRCFNCPKTNYVWGISAGYAQKELDDSAVYDYNYNKSSYETLLDGFQVGVRFEPLFKYGFGVNTGLFYEYYFDAGDSSDYKEHALSVPLHLEYRFNFSKYFNLFLSGGISGNVVTNNYSDDYYFNTTFDYGGGIRINHFQMNIEQKVMRDEYKCLVVSWSYMF